MHAGPQRFSAGRIREPGRGLADLPGRVACGLDAEMVEALLQVGRAVQPRNSAEAGRVVAVVRQDFGQRLDSTAKEAGR